MTDRSGRPAGTLPQAARAPGAGPASPALSPPSTLRLLVREIIRVDRSRISVPMALRNAVGVVAPLAGGAAVGQPLAGLTISIGALNVAFSDGSDAYRARATRMLAATLASGISVFASAASAPLGPIHVLLTAVWAFGGGMLVLLGPTPAQIGLTTLILFIVFGAEPLAPGQALAVAALVCAGGLLQTLLAVAAWPARGLAPERRAVARVLDAVAAWTREAHQGDVSIPATTETSAANEALFTARAEHGPVAEALVSLLNQVERARLELVFLDDARRRLAAGSTSDPAAGAIATILGATGDLLSGTALALAGDADPAAENEALERVHTATRALHDAAHATAGDDGWLRRNAATRADALGGELRAALEMSRRVDAGAGAGAARESFRFEPALPPALRPEHVWRRLRANLTLHSSAFRHAVRLAACVGAADVLARAAHVPHGYWIPMTAAIVLKPDFAATFTRGFARLGGTLAGLVVASYALHLAPPTPTGFIVLVALLTFAAFLVGRANYAVMVVPVTALIVMLLAMGGAPPLPAIEARGLSTLVGGAGALLAYALWPTWEHTQVPLVLADLLDAYRDHFENVVRASTGAMAPGDARLDATRLAARLARSNAEASVDRLQGEPGRGAGLYGPAVRFLASSRRFARAMMAIEATLGDAHDRRPWPPEATAFAFDVNVALEALAAAIRGQAGALAAMPDTRADQLALGDAAARRGDLATPGVSLVVDQTDRMANAVNTMLDLVRAASLAPNAAPPAPAAAANDPAPLAS